MSDTVLALASLLFLFAIFIISLRVLYVIRQPPNPSKLNGGRVLSAEEQRVLQLRLAKQAERLRRDRAEEQRKAAIATAKPSLYQEKLNLRELERSAQEAAELEAERKEYEEYAKWKSSMAVTEGGESSEMALSSVEDLVKHFLSNTRVDLTETSDKFRIPVNQLIERIADFENLRLIYGAIDDRGRFLSISIEEVTDLHKYMRTLSSRKPIQDLISDMNNILRISSSSKAHTNYQKEYEP